MKGLVTGILLGVGIGLLFAPQSGDKTRRFLNQRWEELRENDLVKQYLPAFSADLSQTRSAVGSLIQAVFGRVKASDSTMTGLARIAVDKMMGYQASVNGLARFGTSMQKKVS
jgi:gas vesicle protein